MTRRPHHTVAGLPPSGPGEPSTAVPRRSVKGSLWFGLAIVTCPCHLPLLLAVLAGTSVAGVLSQYVGLTVLALTLIFVPALLLGLRALGRAERPET